MNEKFADIMHKKMFYIICLIVFAIGLIAISLTLAYFHQRDEVKNKFSAAGVSIELFEDRWNQTGKQLAQKLEPGMIIPKDPRAENSSESKNVFVRLSVTFYKVVNKKKGLYVPAGVSSKASDAEKKEAALKAFAPYIFSNEASKGGTVADTYTSENRKDLADATGVSLLKMVAGNIGTPTDDKNKDVISQNPHFVYYDGYFYYVLSDEEKTDDILDQLDDFDKKAGLCKQLKPNESTEKLFDEVKVPITKTQYHTLFISGFQIEITAEGIPADYLDLYTKDKEVLSVTNAESLKCYSVEAIADAFKAYAASGN